jgi:hypothetical protein
MPNQYPYAEKLRTVGQFFDAEAARQVEIVEYDAFLHVTWHTPRGVTQTRLLDDLTIGQLREEARTRRAGLMERPQGHAELLRTLGQEFDAAGLSLGSIVEEPHGYRASGVADRCYYNQLFTLGELHAVSGERPQQRFPAELTRSGY